MLTLGLKAHLCLPSVPTHNPLALIIQIKNLFCLFTKVSNIEIASVRLCPCHLNIKTCFSCMLLCLKTFRIVSCWTLLCYALRVTGYGAFKAYGSD